jgi:SAM-dependent methyltransferase
MTPELPGLDIGQHNAEIHENLRHWERKPALQHEYHRFYRKIAGQLVNVPPGPVLECGSGIGNLKSVLPQAITSDLFPNPWLDRQENIFALSFPSASLSGVVLFDVFHHLQYPGTALRELHRVLKPGGRAIIFEPAAGLLGRVVLGLFHHEPFALHEPIAWEAPAHFDPHVVSYYAAQGNAWRIFGRHDYDSQLAGWTLPQVYYFPALPWLLTGGFRGPNFCRGLLRPLAAGVETLLSLAPRFFASRMLVVLEKNPA